MRNYTILLLAFAINFFSVNYCEAQLLKRVLKKTTDKLGGSFEDYLSDKASDALAKKIDQGFTNLLDTKIDAAFKKSSKYNPQASEAENSQNKASFLAQLSSTAELPEGYVFDIEMIVETGSKKTETIQYYFSKNKAYFGVETKDGSNEALVIFDGENHIMAMYATDKKGNKTAYALPNMFEVAGVLVAASTEKDALNTSINKTGGSKNILGYTCQEYQTSSNSGLTKFYTTKAIQLSNTNIFGHLIETFKKSLSDTGFDQVEGVLMYAESYNKKGKLNHRWEVTAIDQLQLSINSADYITVAGVGAK